MQYFKHMSNMRHGTDIRRLINKYGLEGYGLYNIILESIVENICDERPEPELKDTCEDMAELYRGDSAKYDEMVRYMVDRGILEVDEITRRVTCHKIYKILEKSAIRSKQIRELISLYKNVQNVPDNPGQSETNQDNPGQVQTNLIDADIDKDTDEDKDNIHARIKKIFEDGSEKLIGKKYRHNAKEAANIKQLEVLYNKDPQDFILMCDKYMTAIQSDDNFWNGKPFIPSMFNSLYNHITNYKPKKKQKQFKEESAFLNSCTEEEKKALGNLLNNNILGITYEK